MALTIKTAGAIVSVVKNDPNCKKNIDSILAYILPDSAGAAGGVRNFLMVLVDTPNYAAEKLVNKARDAGSFVGLMDPAKERYIAPKIFSNQDPDVDKLICTGIAEATAAVIKTALPTNKGLADIESAQAISRETGIAHAGTHITMKDGTDYVFDWHTTLAVENPTIYLTKNWHQCTGGTLFERFGGFT
ncbi:hypothetical protein AB833_19230 [Chromatiales bacterium (ex Bugula neritina AB1)]|nr:hypothetical protein AB833_19230 [Chromatiales bacterium (ex Bugula neritina AB1)]